MNGCDVKVTTYLENFLCVEVGVGELWATYPDSFIRLRGKGSLTVRIGEYGESFPVQAFSGA